MVYAFQEIEKSALNGGKEGNCVQDARKSNFTAKCFNTFVAIDSLDA